MNRKKWDFLRNKIFNKKNVRHLPYWYHNENLKILPILKLLALKIQVPVINDISLEHLKCDIFKFNLSTKNQFTVQGFKKIF